MTDDPRVSESQRLLGQLFMVGFHGLTPTPGLTDLIRRQRVGGVILFSRNCQSAPQVSRLTHDLQMIAREAGHPAPLLIAVDQEGGIVQRLGAAVTNLPGEMALGATGSATLTRAVAKASGEELLALGVNMNLAPVADVNNNPANPVIGVRAFGQDPALVARLTAAAVEGYQAAGVSATIKHFPGHGDTAVDSHLALPLLPYDRARLERIELVPFTAAREADTLMLAHLRLPALAPGEQTPASLSPTVTRLARELGYEGVIMTDCLEMGAIARTIGVERGALLALQAGVDLVLISHTLSAQRAAIARAHAALASGELAEEAVFRAAQRLLTLKRRRLTWDRLPALVTRASVSSAPHRRLSERAYRQAVTLARDETRQLPLRLPEQANILVVACPPAHVTRASDSPYQHEALVTSIRQRHTRMQGIVVGRGVGKVSATEALVRARAADVVVLVTINASHDRQQATLIRGLIATGRPIISIAAGAPYDIGAFPHLPTYLATYEYTPAALSAAADAIFGQFTPQGRLPVDVTA